MKRILVALLTAAVTGGTAAGALLIHHSSPQYARASGSRLQVRPASSADWMIACLAVDGFAVRQLPLSTALHSSSEAIAASREWHTAIFANITAEAEFVQVTHSDPVVAADPNTDEARAIANPVWAVGFSGLHIADPGGGFPMPGMSPPPTRWLTAEVVLYDDVHGTDTLGVFCAS